MKEAKVKQNAKDWQLGFNDGVARVRSNESKAGCRLSYHSGYIEGKAKPKVND